MFSSLEIAGVSIGKIDYSYHTSQRKSISTLQVLTNNSSFNYFRKMKHKIAWISITRSDVCASANIMSEGTEDTLNQKI